MKTSERVAILLCATVMVLGTVGAKKKDKKIDEKAQNPMMTPEMVAYMTPGEGQQKLNPFVGNWTYTGKFWAAPDSQPMTMTGNQENKWINGGRHIQQIAHGAPDPNMGGQAFEGQGLVAYDNMRKEYVSIWIDNMSTGMMMMTGQYSADGKNLESKGTMPDPMSGETHKPFRSVARWTDADTNVYEMYTQDKNGKEFRMGELTYKRVK